MMDDAQRTIQDLRDRVERLARIVATQRLTLKQCAEPPHNVPEAKSAMASHLGQDAEVVETALGERCSA